MKTEILNSLRVYPESKWRDKRFVAAAQAQRARRPGNGALQHGGILAARYFPLPMAGIHITDIESAINWWRDRSPSPDGITACPEVRALAEVYALLVYFHESECDEASMPAKAHAAWLAWYATTPDAPCIAICSTSQGDAVCKGCGRSFEEVQHWPAMTPAEKRASWRRITMDGSAWRFNRYAERAREGADAKEAPP